MAQKIVSNKELAEKVNSLCDAEFSTSENFLRKAIRKPIRYAAVFFTNAKMLLSGSSKEELKKKSEDGNLGIYRDDKGQTYYDENIAKHTIRIGDKFAAAVHGKGLQKKMEGIYDRAVEQCQDLRTLKESGKLKPL